MNSKRASLRICAVMLAIALTMGASSLSFSSVNANSAYGLSSALGSSFSEDIIPGITWDDVEDILRQSEKHDPQLVFWMIQHQERYLELLQHAVEILVANPTQEEADAFVDMLHFLKEYRQPNESDPGTPSGVVAAARAFAAELRSSADEEKEQTVETLESFVKTVRETGTFRHYTVEVEFQPQVSEISYGAPIDLVFLVDASESMKGEKLDSAKVVMSAILREALIKNSTNRVGLVVYRDESEIISDLSSDHNSLSAAINNIDAYGGTAMQQGVLEAKQVLGVVDGDTLSEGSRKKIILHLSDGSASLSYTDNWFYGYNTEESSYPAANHKRWSYSLGASGSYPMPAVATSFWEPSINTQVMAKRLAVLESQYAVYQGIDIYTIDYSPSGNDSFLELSTLKMRNPPANFAYNDSQEPGQVRKINPAARVSYTRDGYENRAFDASNEEELMRAYRSLFYIESEDDHPTFTVVEQLSEEFELVGAPVMIEGEGYAGTVEASGRDILWTSTGENMTDLRKMTYTVRLVDKEIYPDGAGGYDLAGMDAIHPASSTLLSVETADGEVTYAPARTQDVSVAPLVNGVAFARNLSGELVDEYADSDQVTLEGTIEGGSGSYRYQWLLNGVPVGEEKSAISLAGVNGPITLSSEFMESLPEGTLDFELKISDVGAEKAGYKTKGVAYVSVPVRIKVVFGTVVIEVQGPDGAFEVRATVENSGGTQKWYFIGPGTQTYRVPIGSKITVEAYAPAGYAVSGNGSTAYIQPPVQGETIPDQRIVLRIAEESTGVFHGWAWNSF